MTMGRGVSRYHGCISFLEYAGYDAATDQFFFNDQEIPQSSPGEMQRDFMHVRWGGKMTGERRLVLYGPGQGGREPKPSTPPPPPHEHSYPDKPNGPDGKWRCLTCDEIWPPN